jgi:hypothetical protein
MVTRDHTADPSGRYRLIGSLSRSRPCSDNSTMPAAVNILLSEPTAYTVLSVAGTRCSRLAKPYPRARSTLSPRSTATDIPGIRWRASSALMNRSTASVGAGFWAASPLTQKSRGRS